MKNDEKVLRWRLSEKPSPENVLKLVVGGILTKEEARKIVLDEGTASQSEVETIKADISLLRKIVLELSEKAGQASTVIKVIEREIPIYIKKQHPIREPYWWPSYVHWQSSTLGALGAQCSSIANVALSKSNLAQWDTTPTRGSTGQQ